MAVTNIGLRISGTKQRQAGFAPLANAGVLAGGEGENMDRITTIAESPAYVIKHAAEYILYLLIDRRVRSFDADAPGVLSIALTIPSDSQLKDNKSPYTLLKEVYTTFVSNFMERASDGRNTFLNVDSRDSSLFRDIVSNYSLEPRRSAYVTMNPAGLSGVVCVSEDNMEDFFRNTQYKEFALFKDVEVGTSCLGQVTPGLDRLQIPLPAASYEVWVNGNNTGDTMVSPTDFYRASVAPTKFYTYESVDFTLGELLNASNGQLLKNNSRILLEPDKNRISCTLKKFDILYDLSVEWKEKEYGCRNAIEEYARRGNLRLMLEQEDITRALYSQELLSFRAIEVNGKNVSIVPSRIVGDYTVDASSPRMDDVNHRIIVLITAGKRAVKPVDYGTKHKDNDRRRPIGNNPKDDPDYFKRSDEQEQIPSQSKQAKPNIDLKSFGLGAVVGLLLGLAIWFLIGLIGGDEKKDSGKKDEVENEELAGDNKDSSEEQSATTFKDRMISIDDGKPEEEEEEEEKKEAKQQEDVSGGTENTGSSASKENVTIKEKKDKKIVEKENNAEIRQKQEAKDKIVSMINNSKRLALIQNDPAYKLLDPNDQTTVDNVVKHYKNNEDLRKTINKELKRTSDHIDKFEDLRSIQTRLWVHNIK